MTAAEAYEQFLVPSIFEPWARSVLHAHPPAPGSAVLDVACGTGIAARLAAALVGHTGRVVGLDADEAMLAVARKTKCGSTDAAIEWRHGSALDLPFAASSFDDVLCFEGLQFFPNRVTGLREMRRVLRPGGTLLGTVWGPLEQNPAYEAIGEALGHLVSAEAARLPPFSLTDADTIRALLEASGFEALSVTVETLTLAAPSAEALVDWVAAGAPTIRHNVALLPANRRREFSERVTARLARYWTGAGLSLPSMRHVIGARRAETAGATLPPRGRCRTIPPLADGPDIFGLSGGGS